MGKYKYLIFDFDGTIGDTYKGVVAGMKETFAAYGISIDEALYSKYIGPPINETFSSYLGSTEKGYEASALYRKIYNDKGYVLTTTPFKGIKETFKSLYEKGYKICASTCKKQEEVEMLLKRFDLYKYMAFVSGLCYNVRETKAETLRYLLDTLKVDVKDCVMIGDTRFDVEGAQEVDMDCILCLWGYGDYEAIKNQNVVYRAKDPYDVERYIED